MDNNGVSMALSPVESSPSALESYLEETRRRRIGLVAELEELLAAEDQLHDELTAQLRESKLRRDQLKRSRDALSGETAKPKPKPAVQKHGTGYVSDEKVSAVLELMRGVETPITAAEIARQLPKGLISPDRAARALVLLRERELVRYVGNGRGGGKLFLPMPEIALTQNLDSAVETAAEAVANAA